ncbi:MAG: hypothetical protein PHD74_07920, partial [Candidatus Krumholzibacteria bacterium]|nr:hypothetical protein [Candidatus Krumholzibacteria bacterium]
MKRPLLAMLLLLAALSFIDAAPFAIRVPGSIILSYYLPGFAFLLLFGERNRPALDDLYLPPLLSPIIVVLLMLVCHRLTGSLRDTTTASILIPAIMVAGIGLTRNRGRESAADPVPRKILLVSVAFGGLILVAYLFNGFLMVRSDAWYHISIVGEIVNRGIPPRDPWFADQSIHYMWMYHLFIAGFVKHAGMSIPMALGIFNVINAFVFPYLVARMTAVFRKDECSILGTPLFAIVGIQSASWILWPTSFIGALFGEFRGSAEVERIIHSIDLNSARVIHFLTPNGTFMVNLVDKFFIITAFNHA